MKNQDFIPILLGTETSVYNMARAFFEAYGVKSQAYGRKPLVQTQYSKFVDVTFWEDFGEPEGFVSHLNESVSRLEGRIAPLISCGDNYTRLLAKCKDRIDPSYTPVCPDYETVDAVNAKSKFYELCEKASVPYPQTKLLHDATAGEVPFDFPVVLKPDDAEDYNAHPFEGQKKAFILSSQEEFHKALEDTYASGYSGIMIMQEFIPGGDENMRVVNGYKRRDGKVALMSMGQPFLEDYFPMAIGNYTVIYAHGDDAVYDTVEKLLSSIDYLGYFNLDLKFDPRDNVYKVFDFNPRMGRSSYYVTLAGCNLAKCVAEDIVFEADITPTRSYNEMLWMDVSKSVALNYITDETAHEKAAELIAAGKSGGTFRHAGDNDWHRLLENKKAELRHARNYKRYFVEKD